MFNVGPFELIIVLIIALIVLGPQRMPDVARSVGRGMREFRNALERDHDDEDEEGDEADEEAGRERGTSKGAKVLADGSATPAPYQKEADSSEPSSSSSERV